MKDKINKIIKSKIFTIFLITLLLVAVAITGTYAWFTWSSTENTTLTMSIGKLADVIFENGNNIVTDELAPVFNYTDGEYTNFEIINRDTTGANLLYKVKLNIVNIPTELRNKAFKYVLVGNNASSKELVSSGSFEGYQDGGSIILYENELPSGTTWHGLYIYIDSNEENSLSMMNLNFSGNVEITVEELAPTPLSDFEYEIATDYLDSGALVSENDILLLRYIGTDPIVNVSSTYTIDGIDYNTIIASDQDTGYSTFSATDVVKVAFANGVKIALICPSCSDMQIMNDDMSGLFSDCSSLVEVTGIPDTITNMYDAFLNCTSLVKAPKIPSSVTDMTRTFSDCTSLITAPTIPSSVTAMTSTFFGCTNLTGAVEIKSANVSKVAFIFDKTSKPITVYAPSGSTTYTKLNSLGSIEGMPANVTLKGR